MTQDKVRVPDLARMKAARQPITMLTAYDFPFARIFDNCGVDLLLVGDSLAMVVRGEDSTLASPSTRSSTTLVRLRARGAVRWSSPTCRSCRIR